MSLPIASFVRNVGWATLVLYIIESLAQFSAQSKLAQIPVTKLARSSVAFVRSATIMMPFPSSHYLSTVYYKDRSLKGPEPPASWIANTS